MKMLLNSRILDVPHGFSTRVGGASQGPYSSLNLSWSVGDESAAVEENVRRFAKAAGLGRPIITARQVHGIRVIAPPRRLESEGTLPVPTEEADALVANDQDRAVGVKTADCVPILMHAPDAGAVAAVHAGWRGTRSRIVKEAIQKLRDLGAEPSKLRVAIGPAIRACCFQVGNDVAEEFRKGFSAAVVEHRQGQTFVNLALANRMALIESGVAESNIEDLARCTSCEDQLFFSHRRDRGVTGRQVSFIALA
jgi:polyphenol oxidase